MAYPNSYRQALASADRADSQAASFLWSTYRWMAAGLALTGLIAMMVAGSPEALALVVGNKVVFYGLLIAEVLMVLAFSPVAMRASGAVTAAMFLAYAALNGVTMSVLFLAYTATSVAQVFFVTAGAFGALSLYGAVTKRDLAPMGRFMFIGLVGILIASVVNIWLNQPAIYWVTTYAGVLIFAGLTAYDTQKLKAMYMERGDAGNLALRGALIMYLDFVNLFIMLLRIFGQRRD